MIYLKNTIDLIFFLKKILNSLNTKKYEKTLKEIIIYISIIKIICHLYI